MTFTPAPLLSLTVVPFLMAEAETPDLLLKVVAGEVVGCFVTLSWIFLPCTVGSTAALREAAGELGVNFTPAP